MTCNGLPCSIRDRRVQNLQALLPHLQRPAHLTGKVGQLRVGPGVRLALGVVPLAGQVYPLPGRQLDAGQVQLPTVGITAQLGGRFAPPTES